MTERRIESLEEPAHPRGALTITLVYMALIVISWCTVYYTLLSRGSTQ